MKKVFIVLFVVIFAVFFVLAEDVTCENEAGNCTLSEDEYSCNCNMLDGLGIARGSVFEDEVTAELCKSYLESNCGKEKPTVRSKCGKKFDFCVTYVSENSRCTDNLMSEDEVIAAVDNEDAWNDTKRAVYYGCCVKYDIAQKILECLQEQCGEEFTDECCAECNIDDPEGDTDVSDTGDTATVDEGEDGKEDTANTEVPTTDAAPEDTTDGDSAPSTDSEAPAENKEESKSDGCSMLFI